ncbi:hypothetical protein PRK78_007275 [Emydomyces testavorans]|uniref:Uncharacterized protein n=1 Tax=Emydomyces testavorans TaxID=2070801 RepID=A0AAF0DMY7_9EURO|nr:hypothetical protein PRK78_007275 [Emydomyces testavorans]
MSSKPIFAFAAISLLGVGYFHPMFNQNLLDFLSTAPTLMSLKPISAVAVMITALLGVLYFESTFDKLHLYWIAGRIRKIKELFDSQDSLKAQTEWIERMKFHTLETYKQMQWLEYARSTVIRCGETGELDRVGKSDLRYWGSRLENGKLGLWAIEQRRYQHHLRKPQGPRIREYETNVHRRAKLLEQDPVKFISHPERIIWWMLQKGLYVLSKTTGHLS